MNDIAVLMCIYKEDLSLVELSVLSTLDSISEFEYEFNIIIDNPKLSGEVKSFLEKIKSSHKGINLYFNCINIGLAKSLNIGLKLCNSKYIMRMDADDICLPERAKLQFEFMEQNKQVGLVGGSVQRIDETGSFIGVSSSNQCDSTVLQKKYWRYKSICFHPTWFVRREVFDSFNYNNLVCAQDVELLFRLLENGIIIKNINENLILYRVNPNSLSLNKGYEQSLIRYFLNKTYKHKSNFPLLEKKINKKLNQRISFVKYLFNKFHYRYSDAITRKNKLTLFIFSAVSPLHAYKTYLLFMSKKIK